MPADRDYKIFYKDQDPEADGQPICAACLRANRVDPETQGYVRARGPCWSCEERREVLRLGGGHADRTGGQPGRWPCLVCGAQGRTPVTLVLGVRKHFPLGHLCPTCLRSATELCARRQRVVGHA